MSAPGSLAAEVIAVAEEPPPHRLTGLHVIPLGGRITDPRAAAPPARVLGDVPAGVAAIADEAYAELGPAALVIAGGDPGHPAWAVGKGWANLERSEPLDTGHLLPASGLAALVTVTAVLRLVADGRFASRPPRQRPAAHGAPRRRHHHRPGAAEPQQRNRRPAGEPGRAVRRQRAGGGGGHRPGRRLRRPAWRGPADQLRMRGARATDRRRHRIAVHRRGDVAGARTARDEPFVVSGPGGRHRARGGDRLHRDGRGHLRAGSCHGLHLAGRRRAVGDGGGPCPFRDRLVIPAARGARTRGADTPGRAGDAAEGTRASAGSSARAATPPSWAGQAPTGSRR